MIKLSDKTLYCNLDFETTGVNPETSGVISIGAVFHNSKKEEIGRFHQPIWQPREKWEPETAKWWWDQIQAGTLPPGGCEDELTVLSTFRAEIEHLLEVTKTERVLFIAYPAGFEYSFLQSMRSRLSAQRNEKWTDRFTFLDLRTAVADYLQIPVEEASHSQVPDWMVGGLKITHNALEDALCQAEVWKCVVAEAEDD